MVDKIPPRTSLLVPESGRSRASCVAAALLLAMLQACAGASDQEHAKATGTGGSSGNGGTSTIVLSGGTGTGAVGSGGSATVSGAGTTGCTIEDDGSGCVGESHAGENIPLDIYVVFDQSGSMCSCIDPPGGQVCPDPSCAATRLDAVREAAAAFLADPKSAGIGVGIGYFGKQPIGEASCNVEDYTSAAVEIGELPGHASAIMDSLSGIQPTGETPTAAAIRGACDYATGWKHDHAGREVVILLLTDGKPEAPVTCMDGKGSCCPSLSDAMDAAKECHEGKGFIRTFVLGVGPLLENLREIAIAGGTNDAYLVEGGDVSGEVLKALNRIRGDAAIPCEFGLPAAPTGQTLDYRKVNITYASAACEPTAYAYVETEEQCGAEGGWYYDDPAAPGSIRLCPSSCDQVSVPGGQLLFTVGCETRVADPR
jgi:hypothetical protein